MSRIAIILPVLNEEAHIAACLRALQPLRGDGELIVADGGSRDRTVALAEPLADRVIVAPRGRAAQMNAGARQAGGEILWFLHADSLPPPGAAELIRAALAEPLADRVIVAPRGRAAQMNAGARQAGGEILWFLHADSLPPPGAAELIRAALADPNRHWGRFDVRLSGRQPALRVVESLMNLRSRLTGIATGDQGIFVRRQTFERVGGYPAIALMEDIALSRLLKRQSRPACLRQCLRTSSRRWERDGIACTILLMWSLRLAWFLGADPDRLARIYYRA